MARLQINHQKNTLCLKNESIHLLLLGRSKVFDSIISKRLIKDLHFTFFINSYFILHYQWNVEKIQVTPTKPTLLQNKGLLWMQINVHTMLKKCTHHLHKNTRPRIHATNKTHTLQWTFEQKYSVIMQFLQIEIADNISKISSNYLQKFKQDESTMLKKWDLRHKWRIYNHHSQHWVIEM